MRPEFLEQIRLEEEQKLRGKKPKKDDKKKAIPKEEAMEDEVPQQTSNKKKKGKSKKDPVDSFDPLNFKPSKISQQDDTADLKAQLAAYEYRCSTCPFGTNINDEFKSHFKCEWHKINTQRKVAEKPPLSEEEFKEMLILKEFA